MVIFVLNGLYAKQKHSLNWYIWRILDMFLKDYNITFVWDFLWCVIKRYKISL